MDGIILRYNDEETPTKEKSERLQLRLSEKQLQKIDIYCHEHGLGRSKVIRNMIDAYEETENLNYKDFSIFFQRVLLDTMNHQNKKMFIMENLLEKLVANAGIELPLDSLDFDTVRPPHDLRQLSDMMHNGYYWDLDYDQKNDSHHYTGKSMQDMSEVQEIIRVWGHIRDFYLALSSEQKNKVTQEVGELPDDFPNFPGFCLWIGEKHRRTPALRDIAKKEYDYARILNFLVSRNQNFNTYLNTFSEVPLWILEQAVSPYDEAPHTRVFTAAKRIEYADKPMLQCYRDIKEKYDKALFYGHDVHDGEDAYHMPKFIEILKILQKNIQ